MARDNNTSIDEIQALAEEKGVDTSFYYRTTFQRYTYQLRLMAQLQRDIEADGMYVNRERTKGLVNRVMNPAITEFNKVATAANNTVGTLIKIVQSADSMLDVPVIEEEL